jgi:phenylalanine-4-hydroxylase
MVQSCVRRERCTEDLTLDFDPGETLGWMELAWKALSLTKSGCSYSFLNILADFGLLCC